MFLTDGVGENQEKWTAKKPHPKLNYTVYFLQNFFQKFGMGLTI